MQEEMISIYLYMLESCPPLHPVPSLQVCLCASEHLVDMPCMHQARTRMPPGHRGSVDLSDVRFESPYRRRRDHHHPAVRSFT